MAANEVELSLRGLRSGNHLAGKGAEAGVDSVGHLAARHCALDRVDGSLHLASRVVGETHHRPPGLVVPQLPERQPRPVDDERRLGSGRDHRCRTS